MSDHVYSVSEIVGSSSTGLEDAITNAVERAGRTVQNLDWFEVVQIRGHIAEQHVAHYQVTMKVGFTLRG